MLDQVKDLKHLWEIKPTQWPNANEWLTYEQVRWNWSKETAVATIFAVVTHYEVMVIGNLCSRQVTGKLIHLQIGLREQLPINVNLAIS